MVMSRDTPCFAQTDSDGRSVNIMQMGRQQNNAEHASKSKLKDSAGQDQVGDDEAKAGTQMLSNRFGAN